MSGILKHATSLKSLKKLGFLTPSSNRALEPLTALMIAPIAERVSMHVARLPVVTLTLSSKDIEQFQATKMTDAASLLNDAQMDAILWNGTSASWTGEQLAADLEAAAAIEQATGVPASSSSLAQLAVLKHYGIKKFALAVPYTEEPTRKIIETYRNEGFEVVRYAKLDKSLNTDVGDTDFAAIRQLLRDADSPDAECLVVACTNLAAAPLLDEMEFELGKPIFDSIAVTLWQGLRMVGIDVPLFGWGKLLRDHPALIELNAIMDTLLRETSASRTTLRLDIPAFNCHVDTVSAEAVAPGVKPLKLDSSLNQRSLATVQWLERERRTLVQEDCANAEFKPPAALMSVYGVKAQALEPLLAGEQVMGWISVHYIPDTRAWGDTDLAALRLAHERVAEVLRRHRWLDAIV